VILLFGGTSETAPLATLLSEAGRFVLVSTATDIQLDIGCHRRIRRRCGRLDREGMLQLIRREAVTAIVDAAHPYAQELHANAREAAAQAAIPYLRFRRPETTEYGGLEAIWAADHDEAARLACAVGSPVLLTTGSRNLEPYVRAASERGVALYARVLPEAASLDACRNAGIAAEHVIAVRGPFSVEENRRLLREHGVRVLVSKESGAAGGLAEKLEAARQEGCRVVLLRRPLEPGTAVFEHFEEIARALLAVETLHSRGRGRQQEGHQEAHHKLP
jgi:precorrin-6A/cobalt-precorrin-6A reductase